MTLDDFRNEMNSFRDAASSEADALKDSYVAIERLFGLYQRFDPSERALANKVFTEWLSSPDEDVRYDAVVLIRRFGVVESLDALKSLAERLAFSAAPGAPFEREKVKGLIAELIAPS